MNPKILININSINKPNKFYILDILEFIKILEFITYIRIYI